jgi:ABC-type molybdate transport system ATPase subunit
LHTDVMYGHSNGWIEKKAEVINNLYNGTLHYESIKPTTTPIVVVEHNVAAVRQTADIIVSLNDKKITLTLHVLQVWIKTHDSWQLFSRQSTKL